MVSPVDSPMVTVFGSESTNKPRILIVDDEPDNLDLLYRTFRRDFTLMRAESGQEALKLLSVEGEVAVIISDQRMPEMKGTEFLSKTVPDFPDTVRIILTGFTDVEDLVDAINSGQVYRYITKPWDPNELKHVVGQAAQTYILLKQRGEAVDLSQSQHRLVMEMADIAQSTTNVSAALPEIAKSIWQITGCQGCVVHLVENGMLGRFAGSAGNASKEQLKQDELVSTAILSKALRYQKDTAMFSVNGNIDRADQDGARCVAPILFRNSVIGVVSLQWDSPQNFGRTSQNFVTMVAQQVGLTLACYHSST